MNTLYINKKNILEDFTKLSKIWETSENILLRLDIEQVDAKLVIKYLLGKLPNDLAYSIMSEIAEFENLDDELMRLIYRAGDTSCKVAICLRDDLPQDLNMCCEQSDDINVREHCTNTS
jgi:hypothetical protein